MRIWELGLGTAIGAMILANPVHAANWVSVWQTNFSSNQVFQAMGPFDATASYTAGGAQIVNAQSLPGFGNRYLRNTTNGTTRFDFTELDGHKALKLQFDIALLDSWDNPNSSWGPDYLYVTIGSTTYQWAPAWPGTLVGNGHYAQNGAYKDSVFRHEFIVPHVSESFSFAIRAGGSGFQGGNDESWGIDNIRLYADAVPEPKSWAMLIAGFGLVGATVRRRRATTETC